MKVINLKEKMSLFTEQWSPKIIAMLDHNHIYLSKLKGDFIWHSHADQDEMFLVVEGRFRMDFRDQQLWVEQGEMIIVPKGVEHKPFSADECCVLVVENASAEHTGGVDDPRTKVSHDWI